ncbi:MAG: hypothetical protein ABSF15_29330, partial [Candidatus Sulfotelmatobacter sp.]
MARTLGDREFGSAPGANELGCESLVGLISVQISLVPSTGFSVIGVFQWEAFRSNMTGLPA